MDFSDQFLWFYLLVSINLILIFALRIDSDEIYLSKILEKGLKIKLITVIRQIISIFLEDVAVIVIFTLLVDTVKLSDLILILSLWFSIYHIHIYVRYRSLKLSLFYIINAFLLLVINLHFYSIHNIFTVFFLFHYFSAFIVQLGIVLRN
jgi:hypothetical protein